MSVVLHDMDKPKTAQIVRSCIKKKAGHGMHICALVQSEIYLIMCILTGYLTIVLSVLLRRNHEKEENN